jgi:hypothetical protein
MPDQYTALTVQGEGILNFRDIPRPGPDDLYTGQESITSSGFFLSVDYMFVRQFSVGAKYDLTYGIIDDEAGFDTRANDDQNKTRGMYLWFGYYPVEETLALRLELEHLNFIYKNGHSRDPETTVTLQLLFSLGPHKAHPF